MPEEAGARRLRGLIPQLENIRRLQGKTPCEFHIPASAALLLHPDATLRMKEEKLRRWRTGSDREFQWLNCVNSAPLLFFFTLEEAAQQVYFCCL